jgi:ketol-acid reductoisomerase
MSIQSLQNTKIAVLGYGSQGRAQALNLRDSGADVRVGLRPSGDSWAKALDDSWEPLSLEDAVAWADLVAVLLPDMAHKEVFDQSVLPNLKPGALLLFAHGFSVHYGLVEPGEGFDVALVAPKSPGDLVRREWSRGNGVPCLVAVHNDATGNAWELARGYARWIGGARAGLVETTFAEETETDLFGEQAVLCGGVTQLMLAGWETLVEAGYSPEIAYFECLHELKLIVDLIHEGGLSKMHRFVSDTASYGDLTRGHRVVDAATKERMRKVLDEVRSGAFAREWMAQQETRGKWQSQLLPKVLEHPVEAVGYRLRSQMSWLGQDSEGVQ